MASIADVFVTVLPETSKIADGIERALLSVDDDVRKAAKRWKAEIDRELASITSVYVDVLPTTGKISDPPGRVVFRDAGASIAHSQAHRVRRRGLDGSQNRVLIGWGIPQAASCPERASLPASQPPAIIGSAALRSNERHP
jgi:hypothetical protein